MGPNPFGGQYSDHTHLEATETRHRDRDHGHTRALKESAASLQARKPIVGILDAVALRLLRPAIQRAAPAVRAGASELTASVCRLADGSMGRIAIVRKPDEMWEAVCVAV